MNQNFDNSPPHHLDVGASISRMEPGVAHVPIEMSMASLAISINRAANCLYNIETILRANMDKLDDLRYAINNLSSIGNNVGGAASQLTAISTELRELNNHAKASNTAARSDHT